MLIYRQVIRKDGCLERDIIQRYVNGRTSVERQRRRQIKDIPIGVDLAGILGDAWRAPKVGRCRGDRVAD